MWRKEAADGVLIETLWNVNSEESEKEAYAGKGFNRNIVECKLKQKR